MLKQPEKPDYVVMYEAATGRECRYYTGNNRDEFDYSGILYISEWHYKTDCRWLTISLPESAQWRADVMDGLLAKGLIPVIWRWDGDAGNYGAYISKRFTVDGHIEVLSELVAPTPNSALCAAVKAMREAK